jgi:hypothetical protein
MVPLWLISRRGLICLNLSAVLFQRNNSVFLSQQISINRFSSQPNRAMDHACVDSGMTLPQGSDRTNQKRGDQFVISNIKKT